jgi:hypothetical protein
MRLGAQVLIIEDHLQKDWQYTTQQQSDPNKFMLGDKDGILQAHIPTFEIDYEFGQILRKVYDMGDSVYLNANTKTGTEDNTVEVDLWYSSSLDLGLKLANEFAALSYSFTADHSKRPLFTPRVASYECTDCSAEMKEKDCVSDGRYCAYTPKFADQYGANSRNFEMTGREVIIQSLREKCLHTIITNKYKNEGTIFWTMFKYLEQCFVDDGLQAKSLEDCYDWTTVKINGVEEVDNLNDCVNKSFEKDIESDNIILHQDRVWATSVGLQLHPSIVINSKVFYGDITGQNLAFAICRAYKEAPDECELSWKISVLKEGIVEDLDSIKLPELKDDYLKTEAEASRGKPLVVNKQSFDHPTRVAPIKRYNSREIYAAVAVVVLVNLAILVIYRRRMKKQEQ